MKPKPGSSYRKFLFEDHTGRIELYLEYTSEWTYADITNTIFVDYWYDLSNFRIGVFEQKSC